MACEKEELRHVPLFALLDDDELNLLASLVELKKFGARQRIYKIGEAPDRAYVMLGGLVRVTTVDEDQQEVVVDEPRRSWRAAVLAAMPTRSSRKNPPSLSASPTRSPALAAPGPSSSPAASLSPSM
jgi:CRP-like cAMP-binding protein